MAAPSKGVGKGTAVNSIWNDDPDTDSIWNDDRGTPMGRDEDGDPEFKGKGKGGATDDAERLIQLTLPRDDDMIGDLFNLGVTFALYHDGSTVTVKMAYKHTMNLTGDKWQAVIATATDVALQSKGSGKGKPVLRLQGLPEYNEYIRKGKGKGK